MGAQLAFSIDAAPVRAAMNPDADWLKGRTIVHKIVIGMTEPTASVSALLDALARTSGKIRSLTVKPTAADRFEVVLQATALTADEAQGLVGRIAAYPKVTSAAIEHMLIR